MRPAYRVIHRLVITSIEPCDLRDLCATFFAEVAHHNSRLGNELNTLPRPTRPFWGLTHARACVRARVRMRSNTEKGRVGRGNLDNHSDDRQFRRATFNFKVAQRSRRSRGEVGS